MNNVMVCVTCQKSCERLIKTGAAIVKDKEGELFVVHVVQKGFNFLGAEKEGEALEYLYKIAMENGADLTVVRAGDVIETLKVLVDRNDIQSVVMGSSLEADEQQDMTLKFKKLMCREIEVKVVQAEV